MYWIYPILKGIGQGFVISLLSFGPSFFTLINSGIKGGRAEGMRVALGIFLGELLIAILCFFGLASFFTTIEFKIIFTFIASIILCYIGVKNFNKNYYRFRLTMGKSNEKGSSFFKSFLISLLNPFVFFTWAGIITLSYEKNELINNTRLALNLITTLITLFIMDILKVLLSSYIGKNLTSKIYFKINKTFGLLMILIGVFFLLYATIKIIELFNLDH
jgi:threonine/homoserine/homoserine lactone efflux protein